jgi:hypothetical protein
MKMRDCIAGMHPDSQKRGAVLTFAEGKLAQ